MPSTQSKKPKTVAHSWMTAVEEFAKAEERIGESPEDILKWFLKFSGTDVDRISEGDWLNLQYEAACVVLSRPGVFSKHDPFRYEKILSERGDPLQSIKEHLNKDVIRSLIQSVKEIFRKVLKREPILIYTPALTVHLYPQEATGDPSWHLQYQAHDPEAPMCLSLLGGLKEFGHLLRSCPECQLVFWAVRKNQNYCSKRCQTRVASRNYLATPEHRKGKRGRPPRGQSREPVSRKVTKTRRRHA